MSQFPHRLVLLFLCLLPVITVFLAVDPIAQDTGYHRFADDRTLHGVSNFWNVISNLPFILAGIWGLYNLRVLWQHPGFNDGALQLPAVLLFTGIFMTGLGSGFYHLSPDNSTLVWDRMAMTVSFMGLLAFLIADRVDKRTGLYLTGPLLCAGVASVVYWHITEQAGYGDLRPYALIQFAPLPVIAYMMVFFKPAYQRRDAMIWLMLAGYILAKLTEYFDGEIMAILGMQFSGHSLKHIIAAGAAALFIPYLGIDRPGLSRG